MLSVFLPNLAHILCWVLFIYKWVLLIAVLLTWVGADQQSPLVKALNQACLPFWLWCRQWLPRRWAHLDVLLAFFLLIFIQVTLPATLQSLHLLAFGDSEYLRFLQQLIGHLLQGGFYVLDAVVSFLIFLLIVWFVLTLVNASAYHPLVRMVYFLVDPLLTPLQKFLPRTKIDLSPLVAGIGLISLNILILTPAIHWAASLSAPVSICLF